MDLVRILGSLLILALYLSNSVLSEKVIFDGFEIEKEEAEKLLAKEKLFKQNKGKLTESDLEYKLQFYEKDSDLKLLPNSCQVCRTVADEIYSYLHENGTVAKTREGKEPIFEQDSNTLFDLFDFLCERMLKYRVRRLRDFRYVKGGQSPEREVLNDMMSKSARKLEWVMSHSASEIDDPTGEIDRLHLKCKTFLREEEEHIVRWFFKSQKYDLRTWLCEKRVLSEDETGCLFKSDQLLEGQLERAQQKLENEKSKSEDDKLVVELKPDKIEL